MKNDNVIYPQPFVKWVGGKRQIIDKIKNKIPSNFNDYYEPFVGGGAVLFNINSENIFINDINEQLINVYHQIKNNYKELAYQIDCLNSEEVNSIRYEKLRELYNDKIINKELDLECAALFMIINKYCFNGVYRVNKKGLYNVPWNKKTKVKIYELDNLKAISKKLQNATIKSGDFLNVLKTVKKRDFVFFDSPYAPLNETTFNSYTQTGFTKDDHKRLAQEFKRLDGKGVYLMLTNHNTKLIRELYKEYHIELLDVKRAVNSDASNRVGKEIIITNY
ncbi:Dam family site-specific DNA-(adenine-N6)-methyltransferase [Gemella sp. zg-1178]|uniref:DNA adenine methylase n=1 Tax=Gemella sp. zg-1178 TaxID=2840372 RepID=UPI001C0524EA|nr:Dam family site-specific DNA-(adenine-N6)-methyltransferase [Gemella sp. zg-1178]MBU0278461.1 Dam family site-specific DNA-(adenine-N6)-methyltransferase [Gemella sp. zg-1178]